MQVFISYSPDLALMEHRSKATTSRYFLIDDVILKMKNTTGHFNLLCIMFAFYQ